MGETRATTIHHLGTPLWLMKYEERTAECQMLRVQGGFEVRFILDDVHLFSYFRPEIDDLLADADAKRQNMEQRGWRCVWDRSARAAQRVVQTVTPRRRHNDRPVEGRSSSLLAFANAGRN